MLSYWYPVVYHLTIRNQKDLNTGETQFRMRCTNEKQSLAPRKCYSTRNLVLQLRNKRQCTLRLMFYLIHSLGKSSVTSSA